MPQPLPPLQPGPRVAASMAVFKQDAVLLILRGSGAMQGLWSLPGGHVEPGEAVRDTALREVREETAVSAEIRAFVDLHEVILNDPEGHLRAHYVIAVFAGVWLAGAPAAGGDAAQARFFEPGAIADLQLTPGAAGLIARARAQLACIR